MTDGYRAACRQPRRVYQVVVIVLLALVCCACSGSGCDDGQHPPDCTHVLFVGNSYTFVNDLPATFAGLAEAGRHPVDVAMAASGGWTLEKHLASPETLDQIKSKQWDQVVLQEQSQMPAYEQSRTVYMYPAARSLVKVIREDGAAPLFFETWGYRDGDPQYGLAGYEPMQAQLAWGYQRIAQELNAQLAPVGAAWRASRRQAPQIDLWQADGSHPSKAGTYLAACVFYAVIFRESPEGLAYTGGLSAEQAQALQKISAEVVFPR